MIEIINRQRSKPINAKQLREFGEQALRTTGSSKQVATIVFVSDAAIRKLNVEEKLTVFLVEQNAFHALKLAHRGYVMVNGQITLSGSGRELLETPEVKAAYLEGGRH